MKKASFFILIFAILLSLFAHAASDEVIVSYEEGLRYYFKSKGVRPTEKEYLAIAKDWFGDTYREFYNDEFEWEGKFRKIKEEFNDLIDSYQDARYIIHAKDSVGQYSFEKGGFDIHFGEGSYFNYDNGARIFGNMKDVDVNMINCGDYNFLPYEQEEAKKFIARRRSSSGSIDRSVMLRIHLNFIPVDSDDYNEFFLRFRSDDSVYRLLANVTSIEVFEDNTLRNFMGELCDGGQTESL
jgi:hypothetical protein